MIDLATLRGLGLEEISAVVNADNEEVVEIYVPKEAQLYFSERINIANDYLYAAYVGQRLFEISSFFEYEEVPPNVFESILFEIKVPNKKELSELILDLTYLYGFNEDTEADEIEQHENISQFIGDVEDENVTVACPYFIEIWKEFNSDEID